MLKLLLIVLCVILCLLACSREPEESAETAPPPIAAGETIARDTPTPVDWNDFVKYDGQIYEGDWNATDVPLENVGKLLGYIEHDVPSAVENFEEYTVPDNASPFRYIGTPFYAVPENENAIAVYDENHEAYYLYQIKE